MSWQRYISQLGLTAKPLVNPPVPNTVENDGVNLYYTNDAGVRTVVDIDGSNDVGLQAATPGVQQVGNSNIDGTAIAGFFKGDGSQLTNLPAGTPADNSITNAKLADVGTATFKGRTTAGTGDPEDLTVAQAKTLLDLAGATSGDQASIVGISGTLAQFNTAVTDATLATGGGTVSGASSGTNTGDQTITLTGDVTGSGTGSFAATVAANAVAYAKMQDVSAASRLLGRGSAAGAGDPEEIVLGTNLTMSGTTLNAGGGGSLMMFWGPQAGLLGNNQTVYAYMAGTPAITATESLSQIRMPACTILGLSGNNSTHGTDYTITVRKNGAGTAMTTGLVSSIANHFRVTTGAPITFADGDLLALEIVMATGGPGSTFRGLYLEVKLT